MSQKTGVYGTNNINNATSKNKDFCLNSITISQNETAKTQDKDN